MNTRNRAAVALLTTVMGVRAAEPWKPTQVELEAALANAALDWGASPSERIEIKLETPRTCRLLKIQDGSAVPSAPSGVEDMSRMSAITERVRATSTDSSLATENESGIESTVAYDGGTSETFYKNGMVEESTPFVPTVSYKWIMRVNGTCNFWTPAYLSKVVTHEYGHSLKLGHSTDLRSIMYWLVFLPPAVKTFGDQTITPADRAAIPGSVSSK